MICKKKKGTYKGTGKYNLENTLTIGILSLTPASGGTHLSIMLANYLTSKRRKKGVVVISSVPVFEQLRKVAEVEEKEQFFIQGVRFVLFEESKIARIINGSDQFVIFSMQSVKEVYWDEFLRCQVPVVVENFSEWYPSDLDGFVQENKKLTGFGRWRFLYVFGPKDYVGEQKRNLGIHIEKIPWNQDPFSIKKECFSFLESLI